MQQDTAKQSIFVADTCPAVDKIYKPSDELLPLLFINDSAGYSFMPPPEPFPFSFINRTSEFKNELVTELKTNLKDGISRETSHIKADWMLYLILISFLIYIILRNLPGNVFRDMIKFLTLRNSSDKFSYETERIFRLQSILINLASYINISLFCYMALEHYNINFLPLNGFVMWLLCLTIVILAISARHFISILTGIISEQRELFESYVSTVYNFYRIYGLICFFLIMFILYTNIFSTATFIVAGFAIAALLIIIRLTRLFIIFINRHASLIYLILYLCALEILPVAVIIKYISALLQEFEIS
ncbi:MAG TPA: DUF4271 domain-containing protein [Bacteroidales bacterium]|mgnify:CR=1 FL=1|nr:hypothetical protein [Bacteroidales bacterium]HOU96083.1 DUF4271 domain-containing protein [Bacteroidales bacterium]HQG36665.1 DUF4271 domain-containing protein [Bacteroidales bacterium]HQG52192.1 DUF4271 domain-containing protein [Bacteroidales bacterium]HQJ19978.1 DUF4271 domain-containing protein [Bacteroidales bacterium]